MVGRPQRFSGLLILVSLSINIILIVENSIQKGWIDAINKAQHFIYIENQVRLFQDTKYHLKIRLQFFVGDLAGTDVKNGVASAILFRILNAIRNGEAFRAYIIIPMHPEGDFVNSAGPRMVMHYEYVTICKGAQSFIEQFKKMAPMSNPNDYFCFCSLRNWVLS